MGTVYAAYDPDLDRVVALKVLHGERSSDRRTRLLREARAMARLGHPNVITVYEAATAGDIDYVAMELIDGGSLDEWLHDGALAARVKLAAFLDAGRGLEAAHAAGLVHRDFKPHNVLRSRAGRIVVTDFGLARGDGRASDPEIATPLHPTASPRIADLSSTLTRSGALLGTPGYMAPEQYESTAVGPEADQFAFCVALWEALAGRRPFEAASLPERRAAIDRGPDPATVARIPRRLRPILRRGLLVDPATRWPSMTALLAALQPRLPRAAIAIGGAVAVAAVVAVAVLARGGHAAVPGCGDELAAYRASPARTLLLARRAPGRDVVAPLDGLATDWVTVQRETCAAPESAVRARQLACLDVVRGELELAVDVTATVAMDLRDVDTASAVGDPLACRTAPARVALPRDARSLAVARFLAEEEPVAAWPAEAATDPPCVRATWLLARATQASFDGDRTAAMRAASEQAERCGDDRLRAVILVIAAELEAANPFALPGAIHRAELAVERAGTERMLDARLGLLRAIARSTDDDIDGAVELGVAATRTLVRMQAHTAVVIATSLVVDLLGKRAAAVDQATSEELLRAAIPYAGPRSQLYLSSRLAMALWHQGKLDAAHRVAADLDPGPVPDGITVRGRVLDRDGKPAAHARVIAASSLVGDAQSISIAPDRHTTADATGAFELTGVSKTALVAAELGALRTRPAVAAAALTLQLAPTGSVRGALVRAGDVGPVEIAARSPEPSDAPWSVLANVGPDGAFQIDGVLQGPVSVVASRTRELTATRNLVLGTTEPSPIYFELATTRVTLAVIVRSEVEGQLHGATTYTIQGRVTPATYGDLAALPNTRITKWGRVPDAKATAKLGSALQPGDLVANVRGIVPGDVTICATAVGDLDDPAYVARLSRSYQKLELRCTTTTITELTGSIVVTVPALKKLAD